MITTDTVEYFKALQENNNKTWFETHKKRYLQAKKEVETLMKTVEDNLNKTDVIEYAKLFRIYRDVRFSHDKLPYKGYLGGYYRRFGADRRGSYAFDIEPNNSRVGGGFFGPNATDLLRIRKEFELDTEGIRAVVEAPSFIDTFGTLQGNGVKTAPRGFDKQHPNIDYIRKKQFYAYRYFSDSEVTQPDFADHMTDTFLAIRPFFDYMTEILTTDSNGVSIL